LNAVVTGATPPVSFIWSTGATTQTLQNLCAGIYSVTVTDATGTTASLSRTITSPPELGFTAIKTDPTDASSRDGSISIIPFGGSGQYTYQWVGPVTGNTASMNNLPFGTYFITVKDVNGCEFTDAVELKLNGVPCYAASKIITPNDDGKNDFFIIQCIFDDPNHLSIFNRNGGLVYETDNYANNWTGVDGDGEPLPDGGYLWVLEVENQNGPRVLKGTVNVLRTAD
jgi:gliding motility-associated-like protein